MTSPFSSARSLATFLALAGVLVVALNLVFIATTIDVAATLGALAFGLWAMVPYALLLVMGRVISDRFAIAGAGLLVLTLECAVRAAIFVWPQGSTAAVLLVFSPIWFSIGGLPIGGVAGFLFGRLWGTGQGVVRAVAVTLAALALGLVAIGIARPELFPTAVLAKQQMLERVGPPRVVSGGDAFELVAISDRAAWSQAGDLDGVPGDELAVVEGGRVDVLDGTTFEKRESLTLGGDPRLWNWYSRLARRDGKLVIVQQGGGFSNTEVRSTDGDLIWAYRPDPSLAPTALRVADLDVDGVSEFYASTRDALVRLDGSGKEVWRSAAEFDSIVDVAPKTSTETALVVGGAYEGRMMVWNELGQSLGVLNSTSDGGPVSIVDFPDHRGIATAGSKLQIIGLDGRIVFERGPEEGMRVVAALSLRQPGSEPPLLAVVLDARRSVERSRLLILDTSGKTLYDEVLDKAPVIFKGAGPTGVETLFVSRDGLKALRRRAR